jgi:hypothetical protein
MLKYPELHSERKCKLKLPVCTSLVDNSLLTYSVGESWEMGFPHIMEMQFRQLHKEESLSVEITNGHPYTKFSLMIISPTNMCALKKIYFH